MNKPSPSFKVPNPVDALEPRSGLTRAGMPLALSVPPPDSMRPWIARLVAAKIDNPADNVIACGMCNDLTYSRLVLDGTWTAQAADGLGTFRDEALLFGPQSRHMPLTCTGPVIAIGVGLQPGALQAMTGRELRPLVDRVERSDPLGLVAQDMRAEFRPDAAPEQWIDTLLARLEHFFDRHRPDEPDPVTAAFEHAALENPNLAPGDFAEAHGIALRTLERIIARDFGMPPRTVLRRARALDLAAQLLGVGDEQEADDLLLRYFDQSHQIREFKSFFGVTPAALRRQPRPFMTLNLEIRQARRLLELGRMGKDEAPPWREA